MLPKSRADLKPNTADFERLPLVKPTGFREYDARWLFPEEINLMGLNAVGLGMAKLFTERGVPRRIVVGHDYRWYSGAVKQALMTGLLAGGCEVHDIGLALSPMAYYAQFALDVEGVAMVTAMGMPLAIPFAMVMISGSTPQCSIPNILPPVRPNPVWTSSTIISAPAASQI